MVRCSDCLKCDMDCIHKKPHEESGDCKKEGSCYQVLPINNKRKCHHLTKDNLCECIFSDNKGEQVCSNCCKKCKCYITSTEYKKEIKK